MRKFVVVTLFALTTIAFCFVPGTKISEDRVAALDVIFQNLVGNSEVLPSSDALRPQIMAALKATDPAIAGFNANTPLRTDADIDANGRARFRSLVEENYPLYKAEELANISAEKFPLYNINERIKVYYRGVGGKVACLEGYYRGCKGGGIIINDTRIRKSDIAGLIVNDSQLGKINTDDELIKLDPIKNREMRDAFEKQLKDTRELERNEWRKQNAAKIRQEQAFIEGKINEKNGYTLYNNYWMTPEEFVATFTATALHEQAKAIEKAKRTRAEEATAKADRQLKVVMLGEIASGLQDTVSIPEDKLPKVRLGAEDEEENQDTDEDEEEEEEEEEVSAPVKPRPRVQTTVIDDEPTSNLMSFMMIGMVVLIAAAAIGYMILRRRNEEKDLDVSDFYKAEGKDQQLFWDAADADPHNFHYVAYLFPTESDAFQALLELSFIFLGEDDEKPHSRKTISFGTYEHKLGHVAYVGGTNLTYALWREASAIWPELPGAKYFKVSQEPSVKLELPNMESFSADEIIDLGVEDVRGDQGDITRIYSYRAATIEVAIKFLEQFNIQEEGIVVNVDTPNCKYGKDINGIFEIQDAD